MGTRGASSLARLGCVDGRRAWKDVSAAIPKTLSREEQ